MADAEPRFAFEVIDGFGESALGASLVPRMQAVMASEGLDVAAFEFILDADGTPYVMTSTPTRITTATPKRAPVCRRWLFLPTISAPSWQPCRDAA